MTQAIKVSITDSQPIECPIPVLRAFPIATRAGIIVEAVPYIPPDYYPPDHFKGWWLLRERDVARGLVRESTGLFRTEGAASECYFDREPVEMEAWCSPLFATSRVA